MGYDADSFQLVELSTNVGIKYPQHVVDGTNGAYFFSYPQGVMFYNRNGIQDLFSRLKPIIDTNRVNAQKLDVLTMSYVNDRMWMSAPFDIENTGTAVDYSNMNFIFDPSIGQNGAFTMYQSASFANAATPSAIAPYGLLSGIDWNDSTGDIYHLMIHPDENFKYVMYVDEFEASNNIPQNVNDDILEGDDLGDFTTNFTTPWFYDDRYVQNKTFVRNLYVVRSVDENTQIVVNVYHDFNSDRTVTSHTLDLNPIADGGIYGTGLFGTAEFGSSDLKEGIQRGGRLKRAKCVQLEFLGPLGNTTNTIGRQWGINSIAFKFKRRKVRSQK
jgi:hypothetical protein